MKLHILSLVTHLFISFFSLYAQNSESNLILSLGKNEVSLNTRLCSCSDILAFMSLKEEHQKNIIHLSLERTLPGDYGAYLSLFVRWLNLLAHKKNLPTINNKERPCKLWDAKSIIPLLSLSDFFLVETLHNKFIRKCAYYLQNGELKFENIPNNLKEEVASAFYLIFKRIYPETSEYIRTTLPELKEFQHISKRSTMTVKLSKKYLRHTKGLLKCVNLSILKELILSHNHLRTLSPELKKLTNLKKLDLSYNDFTEFPQNIPDAIERVSLAHNNIVDFSNNQLLNLKLLKSISLAHNNLEYLTILAPPQLHTINSSGNPLKFLPIVLYPKNIPSSLLPEPGA